MNVLDKSIRVFAFAIAAFVVGGAVYVADRRSDAVYGAALAAAEATPVHASQMAIAPVRVDVVVKRNARTAA